MRVLYKRLLLALVFVVSTSFFAVASNEPESISKENAIELRVDAAASQLNIKMNSETTESLRFEVFDISGKRIKAEVSDKMPFDGESYKLSISEFKSGIYILNITSTNTKLAKRFVVKR